MKNYLIRIRLGTCGSQIIKEGNAFYFHSRAGAVPVRMDFNKTKNRFSFRGTLKLKIMK